MHAEEIIDVVERRLRREHHRRATVYRHEWSMGVGHRGSTLLPSPDVQSLAVARLLWRHEACTVLTRCGLWSASRWRLRAALADPLPLDLLRREVAAVIRARPRW